MPFENRLNKSRMSRYLYLTTPIPYALPYRFCISQKSLRYGFPK